ncbi:MAG: LysR family transcriptional regulator [Paracoccaceae bacterium]|nr:LysR family transcriptional regulator [Paracoccaceae bacterium]
MDAHVGNLVAFAHVVREGSISEAAIRLGVSQSAVSQRLQKLETAVGSKLYVRDRDGVTLTATGQDLYALADRQAELNQLIGEKISGYSDADEGQLNIIANAPLPALRLIGAFARRRPRVKLSFTLYDWTTSVELLRDRKVDVAVMTALSPSPQWTSIRIGETRYGAFFPTGHRLSGRDVVRLSDLADETLLLPEAGSLTERVVGQALAEAGIAPRRVIRLTTFPLMKEAILHGVGVGLFLKDATGDAPGMVWRPVAELGETFDVSLAVPRGKESLRLVKAFLMAPECC